MTDAAALDSERYTTSRLAAVSGYSVQQIRDLEHLDVIPPAVRQPNGYRQFTSIHVTALRAYRHLAIAVGPVVARATMREMRHLPSDEAIARIVALHVGLARSATIRSPRSMASTASSMKAPTTLPQHRATR